MDLVDVVMVNKDDSYFILLGVQICQWKRRPP